MAEGGGEETNDLVAALLARRFSRRSFQEKLDIIKRGRPTPALPNLIQQGKTYVRHFQSSNYERYPWLTGSEQHCRLYCWECMLFTTDRHGAWSHEGFVNLSCLTKSATKHQATAGHLQATVTRKTFGRARVDLQLNEQVRRETELHNENVKKNREILMTLIDSVIFLGKQELPFRGHDESKESTNKGNYVELLNFVAERDKEFRYHLSTNKVFTGTSGKIQNDLIAAIADVLVNEIKEEIKKAPFLSIMVDETTDVSNAAQLALMVRYVTDTGVKERFVRFEDVTSGKRADDIASLIFRFLEEFNCMDKVVAQCYDGAAVMSSGINGVQAKVKEKCPLALFIHCYAHKLNLVLTQGSSKLRECKIFFSNLNGLAAFFSRSPKRAQLLDDICHKRLPRVAPTRWHYSYRLVNTVFEKREALTELFEHILDHYDEYDEDSVRSADGYIKLLEDFEFNFLLSSFQAILSYSDVLFGVLQNKSLDIQFCLKRVDEFCGTIERERGRFDALYDGTVKATGEPRARRGRAQEDVRASYQKLHGDILDNILGQLRNRFQDHEKIKFLSLIDAKEFPTYQKTFPEEAFTSLTESHGPLFDLPQLKTELTVMYNMSDFAGKSPADLLGFLHLTDLYQSLPQLYKMTCLAVTIPVSTASVERTFSALKRIKTYARNTTGQTRLSSLASMAMEKNLLLELKSKGLLHDRVIELFLKKDRRMDFVFK